MLQVLADGQSHQQVSLHGSSTGKREQGKKQRNVVQPTVIQSTTW